MAAKKTPKAVAKPKPEPSFPDEVLARVPASLRARFPKIVESYGGLLAHGIPFRDPNDKVAVTFSPEAAFDLMSTYGDSLPETDVFVPLAIAGRRSDDEAFAVDPSKPELPVFFFEHEAGYHRFAPSLDAFLAGLLKKGEKTRLEILEKIADKAAALDEREKYAEVVKLLEPAMVGMPRTSSYDNDTVPRALNLLGIAYRETGKLELAVATLEEAVALGENTAALNLCGLYEDGGNFERSIEVARGLVSRGYGVGMYEWFWARNYLGRGFVLTGNLAKATRAFHQIKVEFEVETPEHLVTAADGLRELAKRGGDVAARANAVLAWFAAPPPALGQAEIEAARAWWKGLPPKVKAKLAEAIAIEDKPADEDLARVLRLEKVDLEECGIKDLSFLARMGRLTSVDVGQNPLADLSTLPAMPRLERLRVGEAKSLTSTRGIDRAPHLEHFYARECKIAALHGVDALSSLTELDVAQNKITDLGPVSTLTELEELTVYENALTDLTPLSGCNRLKKVECFGNDEISKGLLALVELPRLDTISALDWKVPAKDMDAFAQARPDVELDVEGRKRRWPPRETTDNDRAWWAALDDELRSALREDRLKDDRPVDEQLGALLDEDHVSIEGKRVKSIAPLASLAALRFLNVTENPITDLTGLGGLRKLEHIRARGTRVSGVVGLRGASALLELDVSETPLASLEGLEGCRNLRDLSFADTAVSSLQPLAATSALREVHFAGTGASDLAPLAGHRHLREIDCANTRVTDLSPLAACKELRRVDCYGLSGLQGLHALAELPQLRAIYSRGSLPPAEVEAFRKTRPDVDVD